MADHEVRLIWNRTTNDVTVEHNITTDNLKQNDEITFRAFEELTPHVTFTNGSPFSADDRPLEIKDTVGHPVTRIDKGFHFDCKVIDADKKEHGSSQGANTPPPTGGQT